MRRRVSPLLLWCLLAACSGSPPASFIDLLAETNAKVEQFSVLPRRPADRLPIGENRRAPPVGHERRWRGRPPHQSKQPRSPSERWTFRSAALVTGWPMDLLSLARTPFHDSTGWLCAAGQPHLWQARLSSGVDTRRQLPRLRDGRRPWIWIRSNCFDSFRDPGRPDRSDVLDGRSLQQHGSADLSRWAVARVHAYEPDDVQRHLVDSRERRRPHEAHEPHAERIVGRRFRRPRDDRLRIGRRARDTRLVPAESGRRGPSPSAFDLRACQHAREPRQRVLSVHSVFCFEGLRRARPASSRKPGKRAASSNG